MDEYNYRSFPLQMNSAGSVNFANLLKVGEKAPDGDLLNLDTGEMVKLSNYWHEGPVMIEFGSIT